MTNRTLWLGAAALVGFAATTASGQIANSRHNFASYSWSGGEICKPCHTPHFANVEVGFLWNHALTTATYVMFEGEEGTAVADIDSRSRMCMSCHDGTVALDSFGGTTGDDFIGPSGLIGTDLQNDHPIGRDAIYPTTASTSYNPQDANHRVNWNGHSLRLRQWFDETGTERYVVGCSTCHTVHNTGNFDHMLRYSNAGSELCLTCHIK